MAKNKYLLLAENIRYAVPGRKRKILDISKIALRKGRIVFALGANGAGKSSLLNFLAGRLFVPDGKLVLNGKILPPLSEKLLPGYRGIELIRQEPDLNPHFRVGEELDRHLRVFDPGTSGRKKQQYVSKFRLKSLLNQKTGSISGGERRRLALACALAGSPEIILLDEPFSDLDSEGRGLLSRLILDMAGEGISFLIVSHNGSDACWLADEVWIMDSGRLTERLQRTENSFRPEKAGTASLLGFRNIVSAHHFPSISEKSFSRLHFPENKLLPWQEGMLDMGNAGCRRIHYSAGETHCMWSTGAGILFSSGQAFARIREGEEIRLGVHPDEISYLK